MNRFPRISYAAGIFVCLLLELARGESTSAHSAVLPPSTPLRHAHLAPALLAAAERDHVDLLSVAWDEKRPPTVGDNIVLWVGATDGNTTRQWLVQLRRSSATAKEKKAVHGRDKTKYLSWGSAVTFKSSVEALELWLAGPVDMNRPTAASTNVAAPAKRLRVRVPGDYLRLGLDKSARIDLHIRRMTAAAEREQHPLNLEQIYSSEKPIKPETAARSKAVADQLGFTPETERAWVGGHVTLQAFYDVANAIPELREIAAIAIEHPPIWKLAKVVTGTTFRAGLGGAETRAVDPATFGLMPVGLEAFAMPYSMAFGEDPILLGEMVVVAPLPPLDVSAGILGLIAINPKDHRKMVHVVVVSAKSGDREVAFGPVLDWNQVRSTTVR